ncbi:hypothetical protein Poli38472_009523 [Pythium oligandrum]|uniref:Sulfatase N-terminal domain-containing protein n=1 Tax=Pythium oligandrum TaxID=41045 RepID=A0A8K1CFX0_PYTOL|nr:hypothetical protein Poli38472_009523 [Pythium oligandrum]|eukprot:TMW62030.1 hypothetical protein Poli38472_009523 [Pythium oligandrum]
MSNKIKKQQEDVQNGGVRQPFFLNHYTISSHMPFDSRPRWFDSEVLPDFSPLYEGHPQAALAKKYVELRYFQDLVMGRFLYRMKAEGVLDDTLVVIVGDHGYAPEFGLSKPYVD